MLRASQVRLPCGMRTEPVLMVHVLKRPARVQVNSICQLHRRRRKLSKFARRKKVHARKVSSRTWTEKRWTSPIPPKRYDMFTPSSACARSSRLTTATTLHIASFDRLHTDYACESAAGRRRVRGATTLNYAFVCGRSFVAARRCCVGQRPSPSRWCVAPPALTRLPRAEAGDRPFAPLPP